MLPVDRSLCLRISEISRKTRVHWRNVNYSWLPYDRQCRQRPNEKSLCPVADGLLPYRARSTLQALVSLPNNKHDRTTDFSNSRNLQLQYTPFTKRQGSLTIRFVDSFSFHSVICSTVSIASPYRQPLGSIPRQSASCSYQRQRIC